MTPSATADPPAATRDASVTYVVVTDAELAVTLKDGRHVSVPLAWYPRLLHGSPAERNHWELVGDGWGIHWPDLDEDINVDGILAGKRSAEGERSFERWLAQRARGERPTLEGMPDEFRREDQSSAEASA